MKRWWALPFVVIGVAIFIFILVLNGRGRYVKLHTASQTYRLQVADTPSAQARGLGARASMPRDEGMLFPFTTNSKQCFWMKNMYFALDIIWLDDHKNITYILPDAQPNSYPKSYCHTGEYVIELNSGQAARSNLRVGQTVRF